MKQEIACCGVVCSECQYYPEDCAGCAATKAHPFWLRYVEATDCEVYRCCVGEKKLLHCGLCPELPCTLYLNGDSDPLKTPEENEADFHKQLSVLRRLANERPKP